jgi:hypothetical protein
MVILSIDLLVNKSAVHAITRGGKNMTPDFVLYPT